MGDRLPYGRVPVPEAALFALGLGTWIALLTRAGAFRPATVEVGLVTLFFVGAGAGLRGPGEWRLKLRVASSFAFALWFYFAVVRITPALGLPPRDEGLLAIDRRFLGETPAVWFRAVARPWLTDLMSACYLSYHLYLILVVGHAFFQPPAFVARLAGYLGTAFAVGLLGYVLFPAVGPWRAFPELFTRPLPGGIITRFNDALVSSGSSAYDVFPSLHVLVTCVMLDHDWRAVRRRFWALVAPSVGMMVSAVYLRYHYAVDLVAGMALFLPLAWWFGRRFHTTVVSPRAPGERG